MQSKERLSITILNRLSKNDCRRLDLRSHPKLDIVGYFGSFGKGLCVLVTREYVSSFSARSFFEILTWTSDDLRFGSSDNDLHHLNMQVRLKSGV